MQYCCQSGIQFVANGFNKILWTIYFIYGVIVKVNDLQVI